MSHIVDIELVITDLDAAIAACRELGGTFHRGQKTHKWYGVFVGDSNSNIPKNEMGTCDHAMSWPDAEYEVGLKKKQDGSYRLQFDFWGDTQGKPLLKHIGGTTEWVRGKGEVLKNGGCKFKQAYGIQKMTLEAVRKGQHVTRKALPNGVVTLTIGGMR